MTLYSHTRLSTYETCPLQYRFKYVEKVKVDEEDSIEAFLGQKVHESFEQLYRDVQMGKVMTLDELLQDFSDRWKRDWHDGIRIVKPRYTADHYRSVGERSLADYHRRHHPFDKDRTIGIEQRVVADLDGKGNYKIQGFIDRFSREAEGRYAIHDYKTGRIQEQAHLDEDRQLALYQIAVQQDRPDAKWVRLVWHYVAHDQTLSSARTPEQLEVLKKDTIRLIDRIEEEKKWEPKESPLCGWCSYQHLCPIMSHVAKVQALPAEKFLKDDGVALVNKLAKAAEKAKAIRAEADAKAAPIDAEIEALKKALVAYAKKHKLTAIRGSGTEVRVSIKEAWKFPGKNDEGRPELEAYLKKAGLWDLYSTLDAHALAKAMDADDAPAVVRRAERFGEKVSEERINLRKTRGSEED